MSDKSYRIRTNISQDSVVNVNINQDYENLEILSIKIDTENAYKLHTSDYGCLVGRVLANGNFGIPNAKVSIFISLTEDDDEDAIISYLYPYRNVFSKNRDNIRFNLLPEDQLSACHSNVGTFPSKRTVLDDNNVFEVYDHYYKFTTRTNNAGDYMIFGIPVGSQTVHVDIDLSDIGVLSQTPRDMIYKGYSPTQFESSNMFKKDTNLDNLAQIISQNSTVEIKPFWGASDVDEIAITRKDFEIQYKFEPTCIFIGSMITDDKSNGVSKRCIPSERMGQMDRLVTGKGTIEMIRKTPNGLVEEKVIQGNQLIDGNGTWCYQIPMNLDYMMTDEYGNMTPTDDPTKGIPTRTRVRFRLSMIDFENEGEFSHMSKTLVPNNPKTLDDVDYVFGTETKDDEFGTKSFRDLFWNNVYTVKSYIPRVQNGNGNRNRKFTGIKTVNVNNSNNQIPYNNMRVNLTYMFTLQCSIFHMLVWIINAVNKILTAIFKIDGYFSKISGAEDISNNSRCLYLGNGYCPNLEDWYFAPGCDNDKLKKYTARAILNEDENDMDSHSVMASNSTDGETLYLTSSIEYFMQCTEINMAMEYDVVQFDFYNDWINGLIYSPRWYADIRKKRTYLFGLIKIRPKLNACFDSTFTKYRKYVQQCAISYKKDEETGRYTDVVTKVGCSDNENKQKCNKKAGRKYVKIMRGTKNGGGMVHNQSVLQGKYAYYFKPCEWIKNGVTSEAKCNLFATDIVLIGSMDKYNSMGIPQTFKKLQSTSFQMPDTVASTNLGVDGYLYKAENPTRYSTDGLNYSDASGGGSRGDDASARENDRSSIGSTGRPGGQTNPDAVRDVTGMTITVGKRANPTTYSNVMIADSANIRRMTIKEYLDETDMDDESLIEYAITEASGIDWGFKGPNQGENSLKNLYFPGGHFLGISCFNSQVNLKSCVNLSRICELGSTISQRKEFVKYNPNTNEYEYYYIIPDGLISKYDINDYGFRKEFSSMNHNGLRTKFNEDGLFEYDFSFINPTNFNGELSGIVNNEENKQYNDENPKFDDESKEIDLSTMAYSSNVEEGSYDYYRFRLGIHGVTDEDINREISKKYLNISGGIATLPVYDNSFYFYFGLKNGDTALDRFYNEFFAECPSMNPHEPLYSFSEFSECDFCAANPEGDYEKGEQGNGVARIVARNIVSPNFSLYLEDKALLENYIPNDDVWNLSGLCGDVTYTLLINGENIDEITMYVTVGLKKPEEISTVPEITVHNFIRKVSYNSDNFKDVWNSANEGYIEIDNLPDIPHAVITDGEYHFIHGNADVPSSFVKNVDYGNSVPGSVGGNIYLWKPNATYELFSFYWCNGKYTPYKVSEFTVKCEESLDVAIGNTNALYYNISERFKNMPDVNENWFKYALSDPNSDEKMEWAIKKALFFQNTQCYPTSDSMNIFPVYGRAPYNKKLVGCGESLSTINGGVKVTISKEMNQEDAVGYSMDLTSFYRPTVDFPDPNLRNGYFTNTYISGTKTDYKYSVTDGKGDSIPSNKDEMITLPSIYRPFFFNAVFVFWVMPSTSKMSLGVVNGVTYNDGNGPLFGRVAINGQKIDDDSDIRRLYHDSRDYEGGKVVGIPDIDMSNGYLTDSDTLNGKSYEMAYPLYVLDHLMNTSTDGVEKYSVEVSEYNGNIDIDSSSVSPKTLYIEKEIHFMGDSIGRGQHYGYERGIRYYCCDDKITQNELRAFYDNIRAYSTRRNGGFTDRYFTHYTGKTSEDGFNIFDVKNEFQWHGCKCNSDTESSYYIEDGGRKKYILYKEIPSELLLSGNVNVYEGPYASNFYVGVYDDWSVLPDEQFYLKNGDWMNVVKHTNMFSAIKLYDRHSFDEALKTMKN